MAAPIAMLLLVPMLIAQVPGERFRHVGKAREMGSILRSGITEDSSGFIWLAAGARIHRYDGLELAPFELAPGEQRANRTATITATAVDSKNNVWCTSRIGLLRLAPGEPWLHREAIRTKLEVLDLAFRHLAIDARDRIWTTYRDTVYCYDPSREEISTRSFEDDELGQMVGITAAPDGRILLANRGGVITSLMPDSNSRRRIDVRAIIDEARPTLAVESFLLHQNGRAFLGTRNGLFSVDLETREVRRIVDRSSKQAFEGRSGARALAVSRDGKRLWVGTLRAGLIRIDLASGRSIEYRYRHDRPAGLMSNNVYSIGFDRNDSVWVGTSEGYSVLEAADPFRLTTYSAMDTPTPRYGSASVAIDTLGRRWVAIAASETLVFEEGESVPLVRLPLKRGRTGRVTVFMAPDDDGGMLIAEPTGNVIHINREFATKRIKIPLDESDSEPRPDRVHSICLESSDTFLVGHSRGLTRASIETGETAPVSIEAPPKPRGIGVDPPTRRLTRTPTGRVFTGKVLGELFVVEPRAEAATRLVFTLPPGVRQYNPRLQALESDGGDGLWMLTPGALFHWSATTKQVTHISTAEFNPVLNIALLRDRSNRVWVVLSDGRIIRYDPESRSTRQFRPSISVGPHRIVSGRHAVDDLGCLHLAAREGVLSFDPNELGPARPPTRPVFTRASLAGKPQWSGRENPLGGRLSVEASNRHVTLQFTSPNNLSNTPIAYSYRSPSLDPDWVDLANRRAIDLPHLPDGLHRFEVRATDTSTGMSSVSVPLDISVTSPLLTRPPVRMALVVLGGLLLASLGYLRHRSVRRHNFELRSEIDKRTRAETALAEREAQLSAAFASMPCATWIRSVDGTVLVTSPRFQQNWGDCTGRKEAPETLATIYGQHWQRDHESALRGKTVEYTLDYQSAAGDCRVIHVVAPVSLGEEVIGTIAIDVDASVLRRSEHERAELERQLRHTQRLESVGKLAGGVAHDFNNILTAIMGFASMIQEHLKGGRLETELHDDVEGIVGAVRRAASLTRQLLTFSKQDPALTTTFDPIPVLVSMQTMLSRLLRENIRLSIQHDDDVGHIRANRAQFEQVVLNLVVNASDAMPDGGDLQITMSRARSTEDHRDSVPVIRLRVQDTGYGMSDEVAQRVFEPYFTTKPVGEGTGLGLSTVHGIVQRIGGRISVSSIPGEGTTFTVELPRVQHAANSETHRSKPSEPGPATGERILVCEDSDDVRELACRILGHAGYEVLNAATPSDACTIFDSSDVKPRLLVTDVIMPEMNGQDLAAQLVARDPNLKVLFMSGYTFDMIPETSLPEDQSAFLKKPFASDTLVGAVQKLLDNGVHEPHSC